MSSPQPRALSRKAPGADPEKIASLESLVASLKKELLTKCVGRGAVLSCTCGPQGQSSSDLVLIRRARDAEKWRGSMMAERDRRSRALPWGRGRPHVGGVK